MTLAGRRDQEFATSYTLTQADLNGAGNAGTDHDIDNTATAIQRDRWHRHHDRHVPLVYKSGPGDQKQFVDVNGNAGEVADSVGDVLNYTSAR